MNLNVVERYLLDLGSSDSGSLVGDDTTPGCKVSSDNPAAVVVHSTDSSIARVRWSA